MPVSTAFEMRNPLHKLEPRVDYGKTTIRFRGSELMQEVAVPPAIGGVTSTIPRGGIFGIIPLNPGLNDGLGVNKKLAGYDQFRLVSYVVEYVPTCPSTTSGGLAIAVVNDPSDLIGIEGGFSAMRDLMTREGAVAFSPFVGAAATQGTPLLEWHYTSTEGGADLTLPGAVYVMAATDFSNATGSSIPMGLLWVHYEIEVRAPSIEKQAPQSYYLASASLAHSAAIAADGIVQFFATALPAVFQNPGCVGWATVVAVDDAAAGSNAWRTWLESSTGTTATIGPGCILYWRSWRSGGSLLTYLYPSLDEALTSEYGTAGYQYTITQGALIRGFKLWNIQGAPLTGDY